MIDQQIRPMLDSMEKVGLTGPIVGRAALIAANKLKAQGLFTSDATDPAFTKELQAALPPGPDSAQKAELASQFFSSMMYLTSLASMVHGGQRGGGSVQMQRFFEKVINGVGDVSATKGQLNATENLMRLYAEDPTKSQPDPDWLKPYGVSGGPGGGGIDLTPGLQDRLNRGPQ